MTPDDLAAIHAACFPHAAWSADTLAEMLAHPTNHLITDGPHAFLMARILPPEAEILTLAVHPNHRRQGHAHRMLATLQSQAQTVFLDVADDNAAARALYAQAGFQITHRRPGYYARPDNRRVDALMLTWASVKAPPG